MKLYKKKKLRLQQGLYYGKLENCIRIELVQILTFLEHNVKWKKKSHSGY